MEQNFAHITLICKVTTVRAVFKTKLLMEFCYSFSVLSKLDKETNSALLTIIISDFKKFLIVIC